LKGLLFLDNNKNYPGKQGTLEQKYFFAWKNNDLNMKLKV
jgi:hypothetical protein